MERNKIQRSQKILEKSLIKRNLDKLNELKDCLEEGIFPMSQKTPFSSTTFTSEVDVLNSINSKKLRCKNIPERMCQFTEREWFNLEFHLEKFATISPSLLKLLKKALRSVFEEGIT